VAAFLGAAEFGDEDLLAVSAVPGKFAEERVDGDLQDSLALSPGGVFLTAFWTGRSFDSLSVSRAFDWGDPSCAERGWV